MKRLLPLLFASALAGCASLPASPPLLSASSRNIMGSNWEVQVWRSGVVHERESYAFDSSYRHEHRAHLSPDEVSFLLVAIRDVQFFALPASIEAVGWRTDDDNLNIVVTLDARSHSVSLQRNQDSARPAEEVRFLRLWAVLHECLAASAN